MKKIISLVLVFAFMMVLTSCGKPAPAPEEKKFNVGICQLVKHEALDAATEGFMDALKEKMGDKVSFDVEIAAGDFATATTICNTFVSDEVDLIMANATPALEAAAGATASIPIIATSITDFGTALGDSNFSGKSGKNISGTCDLAPLDGQAQLIREVFPDAKKVGILFCSGESNSKFQANTITPFLEDLGFEVKAFTFSDSNDVASVTQGACDECDVIFIPTDNTAADCGETINNIALAAKTPIISGEENACKKFGVATISISYYDIGHMAGEMAADILLNGVDIKNMEIKYAPKFVKKFNADLAAVYGLEFSDEFEAIA